MDTNNLFGEVLESAGTATQQAGKAAAGAVSDFAQGAASQVGVPIADGSTTASSQDVSSIGTQDVVENLYGNSQSQNTNPQQPLVAPVDDSSSPQNKSPEEMAQMEIVRKRLHDEYYQSLVNPARGEEESVVEKIEREDKQEEIDLQQKDLEKPPPLAVQMGQAHAEKFPGASG